MFLMSVEADVINRGFGGFASATTLLSSHLPCIHCTNT
jgi:hypothetical protein